MEICTRIKDGNGRSAQGKDKVRKIWKEYFEDLYNIDTQKEVTLHMCGFDGIRRGSCFVGEPMKNENVTGKDEITGEMI